MLILPGGMYRAEVGHGGMLFLALCLTILPYFHGCLSSRLIGERSVPRVHFGLGAGVGSLKGKLS